MLKQSVRNRQKAINSISFKSSIKEKMPNIRNKMYVRLQSICLHGLQLGEYYPTLYRGHMPKAIQLLI